MKKGRAVFSLVMSLLLLNSLVMANGLNLNSLGSRALAMGGAFVGLADDIFDMKPGHKFLGQIIAAVVLLLVGITPNLYLITKPLNLPMTDNAEAVLSALIVIFSCSVRQIR